MNRPPAVEDSRWFVTVGVFDGVHRGHRAVLEPLVNLARREGTRPAVITFEPHPARVVAPEHEPKLLTPGAEKFRLLMESGVERVLLLRFDRAFSRLSAREFLTRCVLVQFPVSRLFVGYDQRFGRGREAGVEEIERLGRELGFAVTRVEPLSAAGGIVSSTAIRRAVEEARFADAELGLGRPFALFAPVVHGDARGATIGFPTANLDLAPEQILPPPGVYAGRAVVEGGLVKAVANIGYRPTFGGGRLLVEVHLLDFSADLVGRRIGFEPAALLRREQKFSSVNELVTAIRSDVEAARRLLDVSPAAPAPGAPGPK